MKKACLIGLLTWAVISAAYWFWLHQHLNPPADVWVSVIAGFFMAVVIGTFRVAMAAVGDARRVRRAVEPGGMIGEQPADGETIAVAGTIRPLGDALLAPFTRRRAVMYSFEVEHENPSMRDELRTVKDFSGFALTPSVIDSNRGAVRLLCFPQLEAVPKEDVTSPEALDSAREYIANTQWMEMKLNPAAIYREVKDVLTDDDGQVRKDWRLGEPPDLEQASFTEQIVEPGTQVFAIGKWSAAKHGLVPDNSLPARLVAGDARHVLAALRRKIAGNLFGALFFAAVVNAALFFIVKYGRFGH